MAALRETLTLWWQTDEVRRVRPMVEDEVRRNLFFFEATLFDAVPEVLEELERTFDVRAAIHGSSGQPCSHSPRDDTGSCFGNSSIIPNEYCSSPRSEASGTTMRSSVHTESKSSSAALAPAAIELAAPPPMPMRMPGPPSCTSSVPAGNSIFCVWLAAIAPSPPAIMIGL